MESHGIAGLISPLGVYLSLDAKQHTHTHTQLLEERNKRMSVLMCWRYAGKRGNN